MSYTMQMLANCQVSFKVDADLLAALGQEIDTPAASRLTAMG